MAPRLRFGRMVGNTGSWFGPGGPVCSSANRSLPGADFARAPCGYRERFNQCLDKLHVYLSYFGGNLYSTGLCLRSVYENVTPLGHRKSL